VAYQEPFSCDHLFNALKRLYRAQDLIHILNKSDNIVAAEVTSEAFHDWATMFK
jgi:hypothetical protein